MTLQLLVVLSAWLALGCLVAWLVGKTSDIGSQAESLIKDDLAATWRNSGSERVEQGWPQPLATCAVAPTLFQGVRETTPRRQPNPYRGGCGWSEKCLQQAMTQPTRFGG